MVIVNGRAVDWADGLPLTECLHKAGYAVTQVAVEHNGAIVSRAQYAQTIVADGDQLEVVCFVGGGRA